MAENLDTLNNQIKNLVKEISEVKEEISLIEQNLKDLTGLLDKKRKDLRYLRDKRDGIEDSGLGEDDNFQDIERSEYNEIIIPPPDSTRTYRYVKVPHIILSDRTS